MNGDVNKNFRLSITTSNIALNEEIQESGLQEASADLIDNLIKALILSDEVNLLKDQHLRALSKKGTNSFFVLPIE